jgi:biotin carboxyl carrier protein
MKWVVRGNGDVHEVDVEPNGDGYSVVIDGRQHPVELVCLDGAVASLRYPADGRSFQVTYQHRDDGWRIGVGERVFDLAVLTPVEAIEAVAAAQVSGPSRLFAPIPGKVVQVKVAAGDEVSPGQPLVVLEAMKMENELSAEQAGRVAAVLVAEGATVESGQVLVELE